MDGVGRLSQDTVFSVRGLGEGGTHFTTVLKAVAKGGRVFVTGEHLCVERADEVILYLTACTDFQDIRNGIAAWFGEQIWENLAKKAENDSARGMCEGL